MSAARIHTPQGPPSKFGLSQWMDSKVDSSPGIMLDSLGPATLSVREILQSEQHTSTLVVNTFWQSYVESPAFARDLAKIGVTPTSVRKHEILVVARCLSLQSASYGRLSKHWRRPVTCSQLEGK